MGNMDLVNNTAADTLSRKSYGLGWDNVVSQIWTERAVSVVCVIVLFVVAGLSVGNRRWWKDFRSVILVFLFLHRQIITDTIYNNVSGKAYLFAFILAALRLSAITSATNLFRNCVDERQNAESTLHDFLKPMIFPCRTTHTRLFPTKHSFSYSYLFVGVPIDSGNFHNFMLSSDKRCGSAWFSVHAEDYLERGSHVNGLRGKLKDYLSSQGENLADYPYAYLVTAPRFLGFSFNPVSFWYLYNKDKHLQAMILEVNNTFDERRMYFMKGHVDGKANVRFSSDWTKDFHVSPFNDRDGSYSLTAINPLQTTSTSMACKVDNNIVLRSPEGKAKIVARVFSTDAGHDAGKFSYWQSWLFVARWWWVGFMTNPRILKEARVLWVKKLQVFYRPEVFVTSIGKNESVEESRIEPFFESFLRVLAGASNQSIVYIPAAGVNRGKTLHIVPSSTNRDISTPQESIEVKILTPAFYAELVRENDFDRLWNRLCFEAKTGEGMVYVSDVAKFRKILTDSEFSYNAIETKSRLALLDQCLRNGISLPISLLRAGLGYSKQTYHRNKQQKVCFEDIIRTIPHSEHDLNDLDRVSFIILLADRLSFGFVSFLKFKIWLIWAGLVYMVAKDTNRAVSQGLNLVAESGLIIKTLSECIVLHLAGRIINGFG